MRYPVIVEQKNGHWRAMIPSLPNLTATGATCDEAVHNAQRAAEEYLSQVVIATIDVETPHYNSRNPRDRQTWIRSLGRFKGDEEAMRQHIEEIYAERRGQREEAEREAEGKDVD